MPATAKATHPSSPPMLTHDEIAGLIRGKPTKGKAKLELPEEIDLNDLAEVTRFVASEIRATKLKFGKLADKAGVCAHTVSRIASEDTKYPRWNTVVCLLRAMGYRVFARRVM